MLKKSASPSCSFGLFGTNQMDPTDQKTGQIGLILDVQAIEVLLH